MMGSNITITISKSLQFFNFFPRKSHLTLLLSGKKQMSHEEKMQGKKLFIMFKFYHAIKKGGWVLPEPSTLWVRLGQWNWTRWYGDICPLLDTCHYLTGSSVLDALDLNQVHLLLPILFLLFFKMIITHSNYRIHFEAQLSTTKSIYFNSNSIKPMMGSNITITISKSLQFFNQANVT